MPPLETLLLFTAAAVAMNLSPGPSNFYVMSRAMAQGFAGGAVAAAGLAAGSLVHVAAAALGLSVLFEVSPLAYAVLRYLGAAYLVWLGIKAFRTEPVALATTAVPVPRRRRRVFAESLLVEVLNPKTALFFLAFLPQFVDHGAGAAAPQLLLLGVIVTVTAVPCDLAVAFGGARAAGWLARSAGFQRLQNRISGTILVGLGLWVALGERRV